MKAPNIIGRPALDVKAYSRRARTDYLVVHCADTPPSWDGDIAEVRRWHVEERGWKDVGYHYFIRRNGDIERGRPWWAIGAGVEGWNHNSLHICMAGGRKEGEKFVEENNFTPEQFASLAWMLRYWLDQPSTEDAEIRGHRDFPNVHKYCPSFDVKAWLKENPL